MGQLFFCRGIASTHGQHHADGDEGKARYKVTGNGLIQQEISQQSSHHGLEEHKKAADRGIHVRQPLAPEDEPRSGGNHAHIENGAPDLGLGEGCKIG